MVFFLASRLLGVFRDIAISHQFGTSRELDAYFAAFAIPDLLFNVVAGGALGSAFIPTFTTALAEENAGRAWRLASGIVNLVFIITSGSSVALILIAPEVTALTVGRGFDATGQALTADLMRWMLLTPIIFCLSGIAMGILNSFQHFALPAVAPVVYNAAIIVGALGLAPVWGIYGLVAGVLFGAFAHLFIQLPGLVNRRFRYSPGIDLGNADVREVIRLLLPRTVGLAAVQINIIIGTILASTLPEGRIAALNYAFRVMLLPQGIIALSLATAVFPTLSGQRARNDLDSFRKTFSGVMAATIYFTLPASMGLILLASPVVATLFQRGEFDSLSTHETAYALQFFAVGLIAHSVLEIITRAFYSLHDTRTPVVLAVASVILNIVLSLLLIGGLQHGGIALANSIATIVEAGILWWVLKAKYGITMDRWVGRCIASSTVGVLVMGVGVYWVNSTLMGWAPIVPLAAGVFVGILLYALPTAPFHFREVIHAMRKTRQAS